MPGLCPRGADVEVSSWSVHNIRVITRYIFRNWSHIFTQNFDPWSQKWWEFWSLNPDSMKNTADPDPTRYDSRSQVFDPWSRPFSGLWPPYDPAVLQWLGVYGILRSIYLANSFERLLCYPAAWICLRLPLNLVFFAHTIQPHNYFYDTTASSAKNMLRGKGKLKAEPIQDNLDNY